MRRTDYAELAVREADRYNSYKDHIEERGAQLPSTGPGVDARKKAIKEGRVLTNKMARLAGKAPMTHGEQKSKAHLETALKTFAGFAPYKK